MLYEIDYLLTILITFIYLKVATSDLVINKPSLDLSDWKKIAPRGLIRDITVIKLNPALDNGTIYSNKYRWVSPP